MKLITGKYKILKDIFEIPFKKENIIKDVHNRILGNIAYELEEFLEIKQEEFVGFPQDEIHFQTNFYITSKKEFDELTKLLVEISPYINDKAYQRFKNILFNYEK